jgi:hypothetical protein
MADHETDAAAITIAGPVKSTIEQTEGAVRRQSRAYTVT